MRVYKILEAKWALEALRHKRLKISLIPELNDPWEGKAYVHSNTDTQVTHEFLQAGFSTSIGLQCFSKDWSNPVLWSHYGDNHRGLALGFEVPEKLADGTQALHEVTYVRERVDYPSGEPISEKSSYLHLIKPLTMKFEHWSYEQEVRAFVGLSHPDKTSGLFFTPFGGNLHLREVIFGVLHANFGQIAEVSAICRSMGGIKTRKAALSKDHFRMIEDENFFATSDKSYVFLSNS